MGRKPRIEKPRPLPLLWTLNGTGKHCWISSHFIDVLASVNKAKGPPRKTIQTMETAPNWSQSNIPLIGEPSFVEFRPREVRRIPAGPSTRYAARNQGINYQRAPDLAYKGRPLTPDKNLPDKAGSPLCRHSGLDPGIQGPPDPESTSFQDLTNRATQRPPPFSVSLPLVSRAREAQPYRRVRGVVGRDGQGRALPAGRDGREGDGDRAGAVRPQARGVVRLAELRPVRACQGHTAHHQGPEPVLATLTVLDLVEPRLTVPKLMEGGGDADPGRRGRLLAKPGTSGRRW